MNALTCLLVTIAGALNAIQSGSNAQLVRSLGRTWLVALLVSLITVAVSVVAVLATGLRLPNGGKLDHTPWWAWTGGLCGAAYVISTLVFAERMGAGVFTGLTITAGIIASVVAIILGWSASSSMRPACHALPARH